MRSSKSRSRSKSNRNRPSSGNVVNRVFDSSGPEGKVRGTPQQIIDKYNQLARDAQLGNDRVAAENFQQHAEHYLRLLSEAQREQDLRREEQERQNRERQAERDRERAERQERESNGKTDDPGSAPQPDVLDLSAETGADDEPILVETPEEKPVKKTTRRSTSRSRKSKAPDKVSDKAADKADDKPADTADGPAGETAKEKPAAPPPASDGGDPPTTEAAE